VKRETEFEKTTFSRGLIITLLRVALSYITQVPFEKEQQKHANGILLETKRKKSKF